jgi:hypothetical protein
MSSKIMLTDPKMTQTKVDAIRQALGNGNGLVLEK